MWGLYLQIKPAGYIYTDMSKTLYVLLCLFYNFVTVVCYNKTEQISLKTVSTDVAFGIFILQQILLTEVGATNLKLIKTPNV